MNQTASALPAAPRSRWTALNIVLMVLGFVLFWPLGLAMLAWILWGDRIAARTDEMRDRFRGFSGRGGFAGTGNTAFEEHRAEELRRLAEERRKLESMRAEFEAFLAELRSVKDQEEFDSFMRAFRNRTQEAKPDAT